MKVKRVNGAEDLSLPMYATDGASGMDIVANVKEDIVLKPEIGRASCRERV